VPEIEAVRRTFESIARCPNIQACYAGHGLPCRTIVQYQIQEHGAGTYSHFQVPEPWVGRIDVASVLFVSSNPSIGKDEHACGATSNQEIWDSHHFAFGGDGHRAYIKDGIYTTDASGQTIKAVRYWSWARRRAMELLPSPIPGTGYAMTEVVHCKSTDEIGVAEAAQTCIERHFENVMSVAAARVVVAVGAFAQRKIFGGQAPNQPVEMTLGGRSRLVVGLSHPSGFGDGKTLTKRYTDGDLAQLREWIQRSASA